MKLKFKKLSENAKVPTKEPGNAGYDLYAAEAVTIQPGHRALIKTNIAMEIPPGYYGRVQDRSGMAFKNGGHVLAGTIDEIYRGDVGIVLLNTDLANSIYVNIGDRPAQIVFHKYLDVEFEESTELSDTTRGTKGYGSSGGITESKKIPTPEEIYDAIQPDDSLSDFIYLAKDCSILEIWEKIDTTSEMFKVLTYHPHGWSPQEHAKIAKKLNLRNDYAE